jgi:hypothetical protein
MGVPLTTSPEGFRDRRRSARVDVGAAEGVVRLRLPPGREAVLLNLSRGGACLEASSALLPGTSVDVLVSLPGWSWRGRATVLRCRVSELVTGNGVRYEAAIQFELALDPDGPARLLDATRTDSLDGYALPKRAPDGVAAWGVTTHNERVRRLDEAERP